MKVDENLLKTSTIKQLHSLLLEQKITSETLTDFCLRQIELLNKDINAVISLNPQAKQRAQELDEHCRQGSKCGPLHGIPLLIKDNIECEELPTTAGSLALKENYTHRDAPVIKSLKEAGAVIIGKSNLTEWANFRSERAVCGWSALGGQTRNPFDLSRHAGGSSSGSAAGVAACFAVAALGTETNGSLVFPASVTATVAFKPAGGVLSNEGIIPLAPSFDTAGPITRNVEDAGLLHEVLCGQKVTNCKKGKSISDLHIGILRSAMGFHETADSVFESTADFFRDQGVQLVNDLQLEAPDHFYFSMYEVFQREFRKSINRYFKSLPNNLKEMNLGKLISFNEENADVEMPYFRQEKLEKAIAVSETGNEISARDLKKIADNEGLQKLFDSNNLDLLIAPTSGAASVIDWINGDKILGGVSSFPAVAGWPHLSLPMGKIQHMPIGLSLISRPGDEPLLFQVAEFYEKNIKADMRF